MENETKDFKKTERAGAITGTVVTIVFFVGIVFAIGYSLGLLLIKTLPILNFSIYWTIPIGIIVVYGGTFLLYRLNKKSNSKTQNINKNQL